jgi:hypothetical protein
LLLAGAVWPPVHGGSGFFTSAPALLLQRLLAGLASAWCSSRAACLRRGWARRSHRAQLSAGLYYGGTGLGIRFGLLVPTAFRPPAPHGWACVWALALAVSSPRRCWRGGGMP